MKTRQEAALEKYPHLNDLDENPVHSKAFVRDCERVAFLAGCEHADGEHREFYKLVRELMSDYVNTPFIDDEETMKVYRLTEQIRKHLASFTEREQPKDTE